MTESDVGSWPKREVLRDVAALVQAIYDEMLEAHITPETANEIIAAALLRAGKVLQ